MAGDEKDDELLRRARKLAQQAEQTQQAIDLDRTSGLGQRLQDNGFMHKIAAFLRSARKWLGPIGALIVWLAGVVTKWFRWAAYDPDNGGFAAKRLFLNSLITIATLIVLQIAFSAAYFYGTQFEETVYVTGKQEIVTGELYQFGGCTSLPCSTMTDNGKFYLVESSLYFPVMFYPEANVFANIPQQDAACHVRGYGLYFRSLRWLYKSAQLYQHVIDVSCRPYTEEETIRAVQDGHITNET